MYTFSSKKDIVMAIHPITVCLKFSSEKIAAQFMKKNWEVLSGNASLSQNHEMITVRIAKTKEIADKMINLLKSLSFEYTHCSFTQENDEKGKKKSH